jgi:type III secretion system FlhB-like substrate exporter
MEHRPFPPSPRRRALARRAGLHAASPLVVGALACASALGAVIALAREGAARLGAAIQAACSGRGTTEPWAIVSLAAPIVAAAALAAAVAHFAQTRAAWLPRRRVEGAPALAYRSAPLELAAPAIVGAACFGWLWLVAPRIAAVRDVEGAAALLASFVAALVTAWLALGALDALARHLALARALAMTPAEKREDERLAAADPRWRARRAEAGRTPNLAGASLVLLGDTSAVAIAWDPARRPVPTRLATGSGARAMQLVALARRQHIVIHRDVALAAALATDEGPVPDACWPRLAEIIAAVRR